MSAGEPLTSPSYSSSSATPSQPRLSTVNGASERAFPHIDDLKDDALADINRSQSISQLLERAEKSLAQARTHIDFRRPDIAFVEYLRAFEIAIEVLPRHPDEVRFIHDSHGAQRLQLLQRRINSMDDQFGNIKTIIINNNRRSGVLPRRHQYQKTIEHTRPELVGSAAAERTRPPVSPKPDKLHSRALSHATASINETPASLTGEALADRFAKLRDLGQADGGKRPGSRESLVSVQRQPISIATTVDFGGSLAPLPRSSTSETPRPQGPRDMPDGIIGPPRPLKLPLDTEFAAAMPKAPSPTYSPARNMQTTGNIAPPRHSARSLAGPSSRKSSLVPSSASANAPNGSIEYFPSTTSNGSAPVQPPRRKSVHVPKEAWITAAKLYDYLDRYSVLLIDFRAREVFDQGHIFTRNILCVDPLIVQQGMSAAELANKLVLSPEEEQEIFLRRDEFDLVVYYDGQTRSENYLTHPHNEAELKLRHLHEALYEFNPDRPLQRPPILLIGGILAWADLMGNQALVVTNTQSKLKKGRAVKKQQPAREGPLRMPKRRLREYNPLDAEEEQKWRARAMSESVPETSAFENIREEGNHAGTIQEDEFTLPQYPTIEDFNARFPEAHTLGMPKAAPVRPPQPHAHPIKIPEYPVAPSASVYPPIPARPAPAAPRMSYTGVSDRAVSQNTPTPRTSSQLIPYIPPKYLSANLRLPRTGIVNFGSTCYMNATLQALSATTPLSIMFLDDQFKKLVEKDNWKGSHGLLPEIYSNTLRSLWKGDVDYIKPTTFFTFVGRLNAMFKDPGQQQDAQEFFSMIVDVLHEDLNSNWTRSPLRALTEAEEKKRERMPKLIVAKMEWGRYNHRDSSFLTSLFYGQQASRLRCPECGLTSTQYDALALLQVEIPDCKEARIQECFRQHFKDEILDEDNQWTCPDCKAPRRAWKKLTMTRAPPFLVVGLKRFKTNPRTGDQRKIHTAVRFPLEGLDMEEFILPPPSPREAQEIATQYGADGLKTDVSLTPPYVYDAYAVVRHMGESTRSGHYTAAVKDKARGCWRFFNDTAAIDFEPRGLNQAKALDNDQAYLVFYQRCLPNNIKESR